MQEFNAFIQAVNTLFKWSWSMIKNAHITFGVFISFIYLSVPTEKDNGGK